ncbi:TetR/AcrR family transcriptional regulator [Sphingobium algorifonticola]|uniref:TetR/AcrR family transcriptional regulator n=1 Tax=Sphingobium algorifonticola TaxID=2008318 RepID=UPI0013E3E507|nr:TetR/AcrR family transcriptional regulator [Sphingobium algorifonticola]
MSRAAKKTKADDSLSFSRHLTAAAQADGKRKGERTRDRLKAAAVVLLETVGYRELRVTDINEHAGVSNALFYVYFKNKQEITQEVLGEFLNVLGKPQQADRPPHANAAESIYYGNLDYSRSVVANPGLMRCLIQFGDEIPEFGRMWNDWNDNWVERACRALIRHEKPALGSEAELRLAVSGLGLMVDGLLRKIFVENSAGLSTAAGTLERDPETLALFLTKLWYRSIYCRELEWMPAAGEEPEPVRTQVRPHRGMTAETLRTPG